MRLLEQEIQDSQETIWRYYDQHGRDLPWRIAEADGVFDPYKIMVSEIMLQQTQVPRVVSKYLAFLELFPDAQTLATANLEAVLRAWSGLGYNRRARFLWLAAQKVMDEFGGVMPRDVTSLQTLPGIGHNTAAAIMAYAYDAPVVFIETNIRTVFIHHFFQDRSGVHDKEILDLVEQTLPGEHIRLWYWALMDYGSNLKATVGNASKNSQHYTKQSRFEGSKRQIRGQVIRQLTDGPRSQTELMAAVDDLRLTDVLTDLAKEGMIQKSGDNFHL